MKSNPEHNKTNTREIENNIGARHKLINVVNKKMKSHPESNKSSIPQNENQSKTE